MTEYLRKAMRAAIRDGSRKPLIVCGAGVSSQATNQVAPSWQKLIESGINRVSDLDANMATWAEDSIARLEQGDAAKWIAVADEVTEKLGGARNAEFAAWLHSKIGALTAVRNDLLEPLL